MYQFRIHDPPLQAGSKQKHAMQSSFLPVSGHTATRHTLCDRKRRDSYPTKKTLKIRTYAKAAFAHPMHPSNTGYMPRL